MKPRVRGGPAAAAGLAVTEDEPVMIRREPTQPPRESVEVAGGPPRTPRTFRPPVSRRRIAQVAAAGVGVVGMGWMILGAWRSASGWLAGRPEHTVRFDAIELDPAPPDAVEGGRRAILDRVRTRAKYPESLHLLEVDLQALGLAFARHSPWIAKVDRVERRYPGRLIVRATYREPVARVALGSGAFLAVSGDGAVLAGEDLTSGAASRLVWISTKTLVDAAEGTFLGADSAGGIAPEVAEAVRLARFLREEESDPPRVAALHLEDGAGRLLAKTRRDVWVYWRHGPGDEVEGEPSAREKLARLARWEERNADRPPDDLSCLIFTADSVEYRKARPRPPREIPPPARPVAGKG